MRLTNSSLLLAATTAVASTLPNPITQDLLFTNNTYDIGKSGASRPRDLFTSRNAVIGADLTVTEDIVVSGTGPHAFGAATNDYTRFYIGGNYASGGASTALYGTYHAGALTGHSGDSAGITGMRLDCSTVTAGNATLVSQLSVHEPQITVGSGAVDNSASVYIQAAATEATNDYALWVDSGLSRFDGNVAIGGTDAVSLLDVRGPTGTGAAPAGVLTLATNELTIVDNDVLGRIEFRSPIATAGTDAIVTAASIWAEANDTFSATVNAADIVFATAASGAATEKMRILSSGNVGINIAAPDGTLHVQTATAGSVAATAGADDLVVENSTHAGMTFLSPSGNYQQTIAFGDVGDADSGRIQYDHNSNLLSFWTEGSSRVTISSSGRVKMPAVYDVSGSGAALYIESDGNLFRIVSARRYKDNINYDNVSGDAVYDLRPVTYTLKDIENPVEQVGFIAEDVEEVDPRLVVYSKEGTVDALHYDRVTVLLVKAMQDQKATYDASLAQLDARITALEP